MDKKVWYVVHAIVLPEAEEAAAFALNSFEILGIEITEHPKTNASTVVVSAYFDRRPDENRIREEIETALKNFDFESNALDSISISEVENADWLAEWKKHWKPVTVGRFIVAAPWHDVIEENRTLIRIEPNMAFGTGTHATTQLCLAAIDKFLRAGDSFLDIGTGTGILAIAAAKASKPSAARVMAIDNDPVAIAIARENALLNGVGGSIDFRVDTMSSKPQLFDLAAANLTLDVIMPILPILLEIAKRTLILSGILDEQEDEVRSKLAELGFTRTRVTRAGEWVAITVLKS